MSASRVTPKTPSSRLSQTPAVPNVLLTYQPSLTSLPCASFATRATTSSRIAGSTLTNLAKPSPQRAGVRPLPELPNASPRTPGPDASSTLSPGSQAAPWPDQSWAFPCLFPLAVLACFHVALAHSASVLTASLNAVGNRLCVRRVQVEGTPTCHRCAHCPSVVATNRNSSSTGLFPTHAGNSRWCPLVPGPFAWSCSAAICAPLDAPWIHTLPSLCAKNNNVPPPPEVRDEQSMNRLHAVTPSRGNRRTSLPSRASTSTISSGESGVV
mmetsp:Transcript_9772/g.36274  ORF Transcript_9772/g.36274 Transcript_9772/m.36274 type:complete len:269 (+) Transcript_9772:1469-2275(+)